VNEDDAKMQLYQRLSQSVRSARSPGEYAIFRSYYKLYAPVLGDKLPALLPQVFLHYDPYTKRQRGDEQFLARQRMDFLLMLENAVRIVIEVDGRHHYANEDGKDRWLADAQRYAEMAGEDRRLRLSGYEVYRFGGAEFLDVAMDTWTVGERSEAMLKGFFDRLLKKHRVLQQ
jgi:very-short-patch-repair endonuclease